MAAVRGLPTPIKVSFQMQATPVNIRLGELIQTQIAEAGFELELMPFDNATALQNQVNGNFDVSLGRWSGRVDPDANIYRFQHSTGADNYGKASDPEIDDLLDECRAEYDSGQAKAIYAQVGKRCEPDATRSPPARSPVLRPHDAAVQGYDLYVDGMPRLSRHLAIAALGGR